MTFAEDLATGAEDFQDYVLHELLHLRYRDHGKQYEAMMAALVGELTGAGAGQQALDRTTDEAGR